MHIHMIAFVALIGILYYHFDAFH